jgi:hypothetical protein
LVDFKRIVLCMSVIPLIIFPMLAPRAEAWSVSGHEIIVSKACKLFPSQWGDFLRYYEWLLNDTVAYPDTFYKGRDPAESPRHFIDLEIWNQSRPETGTLPFAVEEFGQSMAQAIKIGDWNKMLLDAGRLAHYISDICQPYHSTVNYDPATKSGTRLHAVLDGALQDHLSEIKLISSIGILQTVNFREYSFALARQSQSFLAEINTTLIDQNLPWSPRLTQIIENRTNTAIMATANVWHSAILLSKTTAPMLPTTKVLIIVAKSSIETVDVTRDNAFEFSVTDSLGVKITSEIRAEIVNIVLETESYQDLTDPLIHYRIPLSASKLQNLRGAVELDITAQTPGYESAKLVVPLRIEEPGTIEPRSSVQPNYMIYVSVVAAIIMLLSSMLLLREYRKHKETA